MNERPWASDGFRGEVRQFVDRIADGNVEPAAMDLWSTAFTQVDRWIFAEGLWNIWGAITDEFTHPRGDSAEGIRVSARSAVALGAVLGDEAGERRYCDAWVQRIRG